MLRIAPSGHHQYILCPDRSNMQQLTFQECTSRVITGLSGTRPDADARLHTVMLFVFLTGAGTKSDIASRNSSLIER